MNVRDTIIEIIQKECELYRLKEFGLLTSVEKEADLLMTLLPVVANDSFVDIDSFRLWKKKVIDLFYTRLGYMDFLKHNKHKVAFSRFLLTLRKRLVKELQLKWTEETIDSSLAVSSHSLAFKLSVMISEEADRLLYPTLDSCCSPHELEDNCNSFCREYYPVDVDRLLKLLRKDDREFWNDIYLLIKYLAVRVTSYLLLSNQYRDDIEQDTWSESSLLFRDKILKDLIPTFASAIHLRNYIIRICQNKCYEVMRRNRREEVLMNNPVADSDILLSKMAEDKEPAWPDVDRNNIIDIDLDSDYEVSMALTAVLWDKAEPWYTKLIDGIEEKVNVVRLHYVHGLSYEQIAISKASEVSEPGSIDLHRMQARLRQDVVRTRKVLKERFVKILMKM